MRGTLPIAACLAVFVTTAMAQPAEKKNGPLVTVSKETTHVTGPLDKDGYVDYCAALNAHAGRGVTPENNAAVLLWQAMGPAPAPELPGWVVHILNVPPLPEESKEIRAEYFRLLGMEPPPEDGDYFISLDEFAEKEGLDEDKVFDQYDAAESRPWTHQQYPDLARWLEANEKPLQVAIEATARPRYYVPSTTKGTYPMLIAAWWQAMRKSRTVIARALIARAMLRVESGQIDAARADLIACHRLARLLSQGPGLDDALRGISIDGMAFRGDVALVHFGKPSPEQARRMLADLAALPPLSPVAEKIDWCARFIFLDTATLVARRGPTALAVLAVDDENPNCKAIESIVTDEDVDWNIVMRTCNAHYDRLVAAMKHPDVAKSIEAVEELPGELKQLIAEAEYPKSTLRALFAGAEGRIIASRDLGNRLLGLMGPNGIMLPHVEYRGAVERQLGRCAVALGAHRAIHGAYPQKLAELDAGDDQPLLEDPSTGHPFRYRRTGDGFLLYSVGLNGIDDKGRNDMMEDDLDIDSESDDFRIRMPPK